MVYFVIETLQKYIYVYYINSVYQHFISLVYSTLPRIIKFIRTCNLTVADVFSISMYVSSLWRCSITGLETHKPPASPLSLPWRYSPTFIVTVAIQPRLYRHCGDTAPPLSSLWRYSPTFIVTVAIQPRLYRHCGDTAQPLSSLAIQPNFYRHCGDTARPLSSLWRYSPTFIVTVAMQPNLYRHCGGAVLPDWRHTSRQPHLYRSTEACWKTSWFPLHSLRVTNVFCRYHCI